MKRRSFFLALAAAAVVWGTGAGEARAASALLSTLLGTTVNIDGLNFTFVSYTSNVEPANMVNVTFPSALSPGVPGFDLTGAFGALANVNNDSDLVYTVSAPSGTTISDAELTGNPQSSGTGIASVTETFHAGTSTAGTVLGQLAIASNTTQGPVTLNFSPQTAITVVKDMQSLGGSTGVSLSSVTQTYSTTPEPSSMALLGIGMSSFLALRRLIRRRMPA
jgi:PEP-CTERM motif